MYISFFNDMEKLIVHKNAYRHALVFLISVITFMIFSCSVRERSEYSTWTVLGNPAEWRDADETDRLQHHPYVQTEGGRSIAYQSDAMARSSESHNRVSQVSRLSRRHSLPFRL